LQKEIVSESSGEFVSMVLEAKATISSYSKKKRKKLELSNPPNALGEGTTGVLLLDWGHSGYRHS
jgi:hypothetical protein